MAMLTIDEDRGSRQQSNADMLARGLGWFSIALGIAELVAPRLLTRALGMQGNEALVQGYGAREIATGIGILASEQPAAWMWGRVGGDVLDLTTLAAALDDGNPQKSNVGVAMAAVAGVTAVDILCAAALGRAPSRPAAPMRDYHSRTGFYRPVSVMRGAARDFQVPRAFRIPEPMRPYPSVRH